jgi:hypothetical protein
MNRSCTADEMHAGTPAHPGCAGTIAIRIALLLCATGLLLAFFALPASATTIDGGRSAGYGSEDQSAIREAYLLWLAAKQEAGMKATILYISSVNGSTAKLVTVYNCFRSTADLLSAHAGNNPENALQEFRDLTQQFKEEVHAQMIRAGGSDEELFTAVHRATESDAGVKASEDAYWRIRMEAEPASFDRYVGESAAILAALREYGYDTTAAEESLEQVAALRGDFVSALQSQNYDRAEIIREKIDGAAAGFEAIVRNIPRYGGSDPDTSSTPE